MAKALLLEIGCEEIPASWLPSLTRQFGDRLVAHLDERTSRTRGTCGDVQHPAPDRCSPA